MKHSSKDLILGKVKSALQQHGVDMPFPEADKATDFYIENDMSLEEKFAQEFTKLGGKFIYCENETELFNQLEALRDAMKWETIHVHDSFLLNMAHEHEVNFITADKEMQQIQSAISLCECLVARTGSVILSSAMEHGRSLPVYAPVHITVAFSNQLKSNISDALTFLQNKYNNQLPSMLSLTTGPSRTADIEKTLVVGVHGPKEVYVFFVDKDWKQ